MRAASPEAPVMPHSDSTPEERKLLTGIYGGSFNPIHIGHVELARQLLGAASLDEIWFVVSPHNPLKQQSGLLDDKLRFDMTSAALRDIPSLFASDYEFGLSKPSFMWNTLQSMSRSYPDREFVLLIGADNWACFDKWHRHEDILSNYRIVIYPRSGSPIDSAALPAGVTLADTALIDISSTEIRQRIAEGKEFSHMVPPEVAEMIIRDGLYGYRKTDAR